MRTLKGTRGRLAVAAVAVAGVLALLLASGTAIVSAEQQDQEKIPYYRAGTRLVAIPVYVTSGDGTPVRDLTASDFEVKEGRTTCRIESVEFIDHTATSADAYAIIPPESRRQFLLLFDLSFSNMMGLRKAREAGFDFLINKTSENDLIAVATISGRGGVRLLCPFGPSKALAAKMIASLELGQQMKFRDPAGFAFDSDLDYVDEMITQMTTEDTSGTVQKGVDSAASEGELAALEALHDTFRAAERANDRVYTALIANYVGIFKALSEGLGSMRGRKNVILFSEGFDQENLTGTNMADLERQSNAMATLNTNNTFTTDLSVTQSQQDLLGIFQKVLREFSNENTVFYVVDTGRFSEATKDADRRRSGQGSLYQFADETNGELFANRADLESVLDEIAQKTSAGYVVTFQPPKEGKPGEFRKISISVKRSGLKVNHQAGYSFEKEYSEFNPAEKQLQLAEFIVKDIVSTRIPFTFDAVVFEGNVKYGRVPVVVEIDGKGLTEARGKRKEKIIQAEVYGYLLTENNTPVDYFFDYVTFSTDEAKKTLADGGIKYYGLLVGKPGRYKIKVIVRDSELGMISSQINQVTIPDFTTGELHVSGPVFIEMGQKWINFFANANQEATGRREGHPVGFPYQWGPRALAPACNPDLSAAMPEVIFLRFQGLRMASAGQPSIDMKFEILDSSGNKRDVQPKALVDKRFNADTGSYDVVLQFGLGGMGLKPGQWRLRLMLKDLMTGNEAFAEAPFVIPGS